VGGKCSYSVCRLRHALIDPDVIKVKGQGYLLSNFCIFRRLSYLIVGERIEISKLLFAATGHNSYAKSGRLYLQMML